MHESAETESGAPVGRRSYRWLWIVVILAAIGAAVVWGQTFLGFSLGSESGYQAVFLTNDQVYFGKLSGRNSQYPILRDIYYLQITQALQPIDQDAPSTNLNLVKLGDELHGPTDEMFINRDHILFIEDLRDDSQLVEAIAASRGGK